MLKLKMKRMEDEKQLKVSINKEASFTEIWFEGFIELNGEEHKFWLIHPKGLDPNGLEYEIDIRWFFQRVPREVRAMVPYIIDAFKQKAYDDTRTKESN
jgi:hypothetical protein